MPSDRAALCMASPADRRGWPVTPDRSIPATEALELSGEATALSRPAGAVGDSLSVAVWTAVSRITGVGRIIAIAAVLGSTYLGNTFQLTNSLPNLVYYGFLGGALFSSLLVPALVHHIDQGDRHATERVAGGFLGIALLVLAAAIPVAIALAPVLMRIVALGVADPTVGAAQQQLGRWLILMFTPQIMLYGIIASASAVMHAHRRFALAAAAPALENLGIVAVLCVTALLFDTSVSIGEIPPAQVLLLGLGTTGAVGLHAAAQLLGALRAGVTLRPRAGWRDPEVMQVVRRTLPSLGQTGLAALQVLVILIVANRVPGGVVAFQIALNFFWLPIALGATPVALSLLPRLSRLTAGDDAPLFHTTLVRGFAFAFFLTIPASFAYVVLAAPLADAVSIGQMASGNGAAMVAAALATLAPGILAETTFLILTCASYSRRDARSPFRSMTVQLATCLCLVGCALLVRGTAVLVVLGLSFSVSRFVSAWHLARNVRRHLRPSGQRLAPSLGRILAGAAIMVAPVWAASAVVRDLVSGPTGSLLGVVVASILGAVVFLCSQALMRAPELAWIAGAVGYLRDRSRRLP
jgi:putative peptidoglycan lipid II flippase